MRRRVRRPVTGGTPPILLTDLPKPQPNPRVQSQPARGGAKLSSREESRPARGGRDRRYRRGIGRRPGLKSADLEGLPTRPPVDCDIVAIRQLLLRDYIDFAFHSQIRLGNRPPFARGVRKLRKSDRVGGSGGPDMGPWEPATRVQSSAKSAARAGMDSIPYVTPPTGTRPPTAVITSATSEGWRLA